MRKNKFQFSKETQIKLTDINFAYNYKQKNAFPALENFNYTFLPGKIYSIIGSTGSGKTTLAQHLNCLLKPQTGSIEYKWKDINNNVIKKVVNNRKKRIKNANNIRRMVGIVFQFAEYQLFKRTVIDDVMFGPLKMGMSKEEARDKAIKSLQLTDLDEELWDQSPFMMSGGQKRRAAIAGILSMQCNTIVMDEPTAGLDPHGERIILNLIKKLKENGKTVVLITHNMDHVLEVSDQVLVLHNKNLIIDGDVFKVFEDPELLKTNIELPKVMKIIKMIKEYKINVDFSKIRTIEQLAKSIKELI